MNGASACTGASGARTPHADRPSRSLTWSLPRSVTALPRARRLTRRLLQDWGVNAETIFRAEAVVSELVTSASSGGPEVSITWKLMCTPDEPYVRVELRGGGEAVERTVQVPGAVHQPAPRARRAPSRRAGLRALPG